MKSNDLEPYVCTKSSNSNFLYDGTTLVRRPCFLFRKKYQNENMMAESMQRVWLTFTEIGLYRCKWPLRKAINNRTSYTSLPTKRRPNLRQKCCVLAVTATKLDSSLRFQVRLLFFAFKTNFATSSQQTTPSPRLADSMHHFALQPDDVQANKKRKMRDKVIDSAFALL